MWNSNQFSCVSQQRFNVESCHITFTFPPFLQEFFLSFLSSFTLSVLSLPFPSHLCAFLPFSLIPSPPSLPSLPSTSFLILSFLLCPSLSSSFLFFFFLFFPSSFFPSLLPLLIYPFSFSFCSNFLLTRILTQLPHWSLTLSI